MSISNYTIQFEIFNEFPLDSLLSKHHFNRYIKFISFCLSRTEPPEFTEIHHIIPRSISWEHRNDHRNLVKLSPREHFIVHVMLGFAFGGTQWFSSNFIANSENPYQKRKAFINFDSRIYQISRTNKIKVLSEKTKASRELETEEQKRARIEKWRASSTRCEICDRILRGRNHICSEDAEQKAKRLKEFEILKLEKERLYKEEMIEKYGENFESLTAYEKRSISMKKYYESLLSEKLEKEKQKIPKIQTIRKEKEEINQQKSLKVQKIREQKALEKEQKALETQKIREQKALETQKIREQKALEKEQKALETQKIREQKALEKEQKALEKEQKALEKEQKALETQKIREQKALEKAKLLEESRYNKEILKLEKERLYKEEMIEKYGENFESLSNYEKKSISGKKYYASLPEKLERERRKREEMIEKYGENFESLSRIEKQKMTIKRHFDSLTPEEKLKRSEIYRKASLEFYNSERYDPILKSEQVKNGIKANKKSRDNS